MPADTAPRHPVRLVAERTGLSPDVLRAWERRYGAIEPVRTEGGQRLYSDADIERLGLLRDAARAGRQIRQLALLDDSTLRELVASDLPPGALPAAAVPAVAARHVERAYAAVAAFDPRGLELELRQAAFALGSMPMLADVLAPLLRRIGDEWHRERISVAHEHAASVVVRRLLDWMAAAYPGPAAPAIGFTTLEGERHEFGAMVAMAAALKNGWGALYFGPELPVRDLVEAVGQRGLRAVALSVVCVDDADRVAAALRDVRRALPADVALVVGGSGASRVRDRLDRLDIRIVDDPASFVAVLQSLAEPEP